MSVNTQSLDLESGSSQYAGRADTASLSITGDMTIEMWVKLESAPALDSQMMLVSKWGTTSDLSYELQYQDSGGTKRFIFWNSSTGANSGSATINNTLSLATWTHIAMVYTAASGQIEIYINGSSIGTATGTLLTSLFDNANAFRIGAASPTASSYFDGLIDEVRMWDDVRTSGEISTNYKTESVENEANLQAHWKLNNVYTDETANANTLTASGSPVFSTDVPFTGLVTDEIADYLTV